MRDWLDRVFGDKSNWYLVDIEYAKFKRCKSIRERYNTHRGDKISNSYTQMMVQVNTPELLITDVVEQVKTKYPEATNFRIIKVIKV